MVVVAFRESDSMLTAMFSTTFKSAKEAKAFIKADAKHWIKTHGLDKENAQVVNVDPDDTDHYEVRNGYGFPVIVYQYFNM